MVLTLPDLVLAVALEYERFGLARIPVVRTEPHSTPRRYGAYRLTLLLRRFRRSYGSSAVRTSRFECGVPAIVAEPISVRLVRYPRQRHSRGLGPSPALQMRVALARMVPNTWL